MLDRWLGNGATSLREKLAAYLSRVLVILYASAAAIATLTLFSALGGGLIWLIRSDHFVWYFCVLLNFCYGLMIFLSIGATATPDSVVKKFLLWGNPNARVGLGLGYRDLLAEIADRRGDEGDASLDAKIQAQFQKRVLIAAAMFLTVIILYWLVTVAWVWGYGLALFTSHPTLGQLTLDELNLMARGSFVIVLDHFGFTLSRLNPSETHPWFSYFRLSLKLFTGLCLLRFATLAWQNWRLLKELRAAGSPSESKCVDACLPMLQNALQGAQPTNFGNNIEARSVAFQQGYKAYRGIRCTQDFEKARSSFFSAVIERDAWAATMLGACSRRGLGTGIDFEEVRAWYRLGSLLGDASASTALADLLKSGVGVRKDAEGANLFYAKAREQLLDGIERDDAWSMHELGGMYARGEGGPQDFISARVWYQKAADKGHGESFHDLGVMFELGEGVPVDLAQARAWFKQGVDRSDPRSFYGEARLADEGKGGPFSPDVAAECLLKAVRAGLGTAFDALEGDLEGWTAATRRELRKKIGVRSSGDHWDDECRAKLKASLTEEEKIATSQDHK